MEDRTAGHSGRALVVERETGCLQPMKNLDANHGYDGEWQLKGRRAPATDGRTVVPVIEMTAVGNRMGD